MCPGDQEGQWYSALYQEACGQQGEESDCPSVLSTGEAKSREHCVEFWIFSSKRTVRLNESREGH